MYLNIKHFVVFITITLCVSCKQGIPALLKIEGKQVVIDSTFRAIDSIDAFVSPYRIHINKVLDSALAFAPKPISKDDGRYNTTAGNLMADIVMAQVSPIFKSRTGRNIDFVLLNHGGIRSIISEGKVTARTAYEVMPFENSIVVAELSGKSVLDLIAYLVNSGRPHPISGMQIILNKDNSLKSLTIQGKPFDEKRTYNVATSDYLINGGDHMDFFKDAIQTMDIDYFIRNAMIDYFGKVDTLAPVVDNRFFKLNQP
ncbi:MAG: 5'-nucleotidase C-terminal domain-containing protein [Maribacter sp.]|nr:5'-nucleotidase C-terminal domain-containing protein [Maribacter sp.]